MAALTPALITLFNNVVERGAPLFIWRLYTITLFSGGTVRFADADFDILATASTGPVPIAGFTYSGNGPKVDAKQSKAQAHWKVGLDTDQYVLVVMPRPLEPVTGAAYPDQIAGQPFLAAAQAGAFDAADVQVDEAYFSALPTWPMPPGGASPVGCKTIFAGTVAEVDTTNAIAVFTINDYRSLLGTSIPIHFYQAQCRHTLFDAGCNASGNMNPASFAIAGTVAAGSTASTIVGAGLPAPAGSKTYALGKIVFNSGNNANFSRTISGWDGAQTLSLLNPLPFPVAPGDAFTAYPGCNKLSTACALFNNTSNFGGQPFIPPPEATGAA
jgi:Phage conserved hypothetical protein BR0599/Uncharacterized conserved protein (DUF2163)